MNLQQIRDMTRTQLDLDESDLPDALLDNYVRDGFERIIGLETRWPFYEWVWDITAPPEGYFNLPVDAREVTSVMSQQGRIVHVDARHAEDLFGFTGGGTAQPMYWSQLASSIQLWPQPIGAALPLRLRGWRKAADWVTNGAAAEVDADERFHLPIVWYCCSAGYAQQEDEVLEATYMARFTQSLTLAHDSVMRPWSGTPKIMNGYQGWLLQRPAQFTFGPTSPGTPGSPNTGLVYNGGTP
jgi:hypothetical protein